MKPIKIKRISAILLPGTIAWFLFHSALTGNASNRFSVSQFAGGRDGALQQSSQLLEAYRKANWNWDRVPAHLKLLADAEELRRMNPKSRPTSFVIGRFPTSDEVAFFSPFYAVRDLHIVKGREGDVVTSGFYIVAFKSGNIVTVPTDQLRLKWATENGELVGLNVFPGMRDYAQALPVGVQPHEIGASSPSKR